MKHFVMAHRTAGSVCGASSAPVKSKDKVVYYPTKAEAETAVRQLNDWTKSDNVFYTYGGTSED